MQKALQRARNAQRALSRRKTRKVETKERGEDWRRKENRKVMSTENYRRLQQAKQIYKEEWHRGPLAARHDVGENAATYGALSIYDSGAGEQHPRKRLDWWSISEGDRVAVMRGRERGKITGVLYVHPESNTVQLEDTNMIDVAIPEWLQQENQHQENIITRPFNVPVEDVRLVYPLPDPQTGVMRDVIIDKLERVEWLHEAGKEEPYDYRNMRGYRAIAGTNTIIPWPEMFDEELEDQADDTPEEWVQHESFKPLLYNPVIPTVSIDELRNKYSRTRTRHDPEYVEELERREAVEARRKELPQTMKTPLQELVELRARQKAASKPKMLTPEQLAIIGRTIEQERRRKMMTDRPQEALAEA